MRNNPSPLRTLIVLAVLLCLPPWARSQTVVTTGPVSTSDKLELTSPEATPALALSLQYRVRVDQPPSGPFTALTGLACTQAATGALVVCTAPLPPAVVTALNVRGAHSLVVTAFDPTANGGQGIEGPSAIPFSLPTPPGAVTGVRIIR